MKRFILFAGFNYYPEGGMNDVSGSFNTADEAMISLSSKKELSKETFTYQGDYEWAHIYDSKSGKKACIDKVGDAWILPPDSAWKNAGLTGDDVDVAPVGSNADWPIPTTEQAVESAIKGIELFGNHVLCSEEDKL